ncbi:MAG: diguanylate cyclase [Gammaproteobacteria bacterium]|nr:diguanylate cyclase [Gammaproteobacteria bacterium]MBP9728548.1 diguanylate cyclase [Gammaproteobacteria bacterium]
MRVMIADQDAAYRHILVQQLQKEGHTVQEALMGREVVEQCRKKCPDLIFMDAQLSDLSAIDSVQQVRQTGGHALWVPIVLMGRAWTAEAMQKGIEAGADDILEKPLTGSQLQLRINAAARLFDLKQEVFKVAHELVVENRSLQNVMTKDLLTGLNNSNHFEHTLVEAWSAAKQAKKPLSLILLNVDFFQSYNQAYGAPVGDEALKKVAEALKQQLPPYGFLARTTGDTFAVILSNTDKDQAFVVGQALRTRVGALTIPHARSGCDQYLSMSFGVATVNHDQQYASAADLKDAADFGLYQAKHHGRNRGYAAVAI